MFLIEEASGLMTSKCRSIGLVFLSEWIDGENEEMAVTFFNEIVARGCGLNGLTRNSLRRFYEEKSGFLSGWISSAMGSLGFFSGPGSAEPDSPIHSDQWPDGQWGVCDGAGRATAELYVPGPTALHDVRWCFSRLGVL